MKLGNPVKGTIRKHGGDWLLSQEFGCTGFAWEPRFGNCAHYHRGIDIANGKCGAEVLAAAAGTVEWSGPLNNGDQAVVIRHASGYATGYSHLGSRAVSAGQAVAKGKRIGTVGRTGLVTGCHLHFAVKTAFPASGDVNDFYLDAYSAPPGGKGKWADPWPLLEQNASAPPPKPNPTVRLKNLDEIRIRGSASTEGNLYAETRNGRIRRESDGKDLGAANEKRRWGGTVLGGKWFLPDGTSSAEWERIWLGSAYRFVAAGLAVTDE